ncbi:MAG: FHA domain-containing protein [Deltaproteobacteria bacterium]|nr:FHA domain-containing protein [Deltaproteobacteria bacterium]MBK8696226.1 FHA domain-containing protein [Deltaproteobacteria bacterium]MBP6830782.1 FHA domain-containing protein [Deltaproteobacteria bacterium]
MPERSTDDRGVAWAVTLVHHDSTWINVVRRTLSSGNTVALRRDGGSFGAGLPVDERVSRRHLRMLVDGAGELWAMDEGSRNGVWRGRERVTYARVEDVGVLGVGGFVVVAEHETNAGTALRAGLIARAWRDAARPPPPSAVFAELLVASLAVPMDTLVNWARDLPADIDVETLAASRRPPDPSVLGVPSADAGWIVASNARWISMPDGQRLDLLGRPVLMRMLRALVRSELPVDVPTLTEAIWPGARMVAESGAARVYAAVATLRRLGLREVLARREDGYWLDRGKVSIVPVDDDR